MSFDKLIYYCWIIIGLNIASGFLLLLIGKFMKVTFNWESFYKELLIINSLFGFGWHAFKVKYFLFINNNWLYSIHPEGYLHIYNNKCVINGLIL